MAYNPTVLSIVSTPIGNLRDITLRALDTLQSCQAIVCEDTRVTGQLLSLLNLPKKELISFHGHSDAGKAAWILGRLEKGEHLVLVSDAGTPGISDPGYAIVSQARARGISMEVIPGASAFLAALSLSGLPIHQFTYLGFLPIKKGRKTLMESWKKEERTVVFYESPHRILKTLTEIAETLKENPDRQVVIARELTKMHEEIIATNVDLLQERLKTMTVKGEFVVVIAPAC